MSESGVGLKFAATRQKAGRWAYGEVAAVVWPGVALAGANAPAATVVASVIETVGDDSFVRLSQDCARAEGARVAASDSTITNTITKRICFIGRLFILSMVLLIMDGRIAGAAPATQKNIFILR